MQNKTQNEMKMSFILHSARYTRTTGPNKICSRNTENFINNTYNWNQYFNFSEAHTVSSLMMVNVNRNMLEQPL